MTLEISKRVTELGLTLPSAAAPVANFVATVRSGNFLYISGQVCLADGKPAFLGRLGAERTLEDGVKAAEAAALGVLAQISHVVGDQLAAVKKVVRLGVFIASTPDFKDQPQVANGASNLMVGVFGEPGRHSRTAVSVAALPLGVSVEIDAIIELEG